MEVRVAMAIIKTRSMSSSAQEEEGA